jgi:hypothetical protein
MFFDLSAQGIWSLQLISPLHHHDNSPCTGSNRWNTVSLSAGSGKARPHRDVSRIQSGKIQAEVKDQQMIFGVL